MKHETYFQSDCCISVFVRIQSRYFIFSIQNWPSGNADTCSKEIEELTSSSAMISLQNFRRDGIKKVPRGRPKDMVVLNGDISVTDEGEMGATKASSISAAYIISFILVWKSVTEGRGILL
jgi:hypothetical protein